MKDFKSLMICNALFCSMIIHSFDTNAQDADYGFIGETVYVVDEGQDTINSGLLLEQNILTIDQIGLKTLRYDSDTIVTNSNGNDVLVERLFDIYYPLDNYSLLYNEGEVSQLPVMVVFHAGQGSKESVEEYAYYWATRGYIVIGPTYRIDRSGVDYCHTYTKSIYLAVQDISAVVRTFSYLYDDSQQSVPNIEGNFLVGKPIDGHSIFYVGKSFGGSTAFHSASRSVQGHWEDYLSKEEKHVVTGSEGSVDMGNNGELHSTGRSLIREYDFPHDRIKGAICRTAAIFSDDQLDYSISPSKVPICFVIGTCDKIIPYSSRTLVGDEGLCDANLTHPDGTEDRSFTLKGPQFVSDVMAEANIYNEIVTFCGGGHDTNVCVDEIIEGHSTDFVTRILLGDYVDGDVYDIVYRYQFENYSNQCCEIGEDYAYLEKCSCGDDNPLEVNQLEFIDINGCEFFNECGIESICDLVPPSGGSIDSLKITSNITLLKCDDSLCMQIFSSTSQMHTFKYFSEDGKELLAADEEVLTGINQMPIPLELPRNRLIVLQIEGYKPIKFFLRAI